MVAYLVKLLGLTLLSIGVVVLLALAFSLGFKAIVKSLVRRPKLTLLLLGLTLLLAGLLLIGLAGLML